MHSETRSYGRAWSTRQQRIVDGVLGRQFCGSSSRESQPACAPSSGGWVQRRSGNRGLLARCPVAPGDAAPHDSAHWTAAEPCSSFIKDADILAVAAGYALAVWV